MQLVVAAGFVLFDVGLGSHRRKLTRNDEAHSRLGYRQIYARQLEQHMPLTQLALAVVVAAGTHC
jgi:hypothetical protein